MKAVSLNPFPMYFVPVTGVAGATWDATRAARVHGPWRGYVVDGYVIARKTDGETFGTSVKGTLHHDIADAQVEAAIRKWWHPIEKFGDEAVGWFHVGAPGNRQRIAAACYVVDRTEDKTVAALERFVDMAKAAAWTYRQPSCHARISVYQEPIGEREVMMAIDVGVHRDHWIVMEGDPMQGKLPIDFLPIFKRGEVLLDVGDQKRVERGEDAPLWAGSKYHWKPDRPRGYWTGHDPDDDT